MYFDIKVWKLILKHYTKRLVKRADLIYLYKTPQTHIPRLFWNRKRRRKKFRRFFLYNGKIIKKIFIWKNNLPILYYSSTITYGERKKKKKKKKWVSKENFY